MILCEKDNVNDIVNIYSLKEKKKELKRYKAALLLTAKKDELFMKFSTTDELEINGVTRGNGIKLNSKYNSLSKDTYEHSYPYPEKQLIHECIISKYLNDELVNATMLSVSQKDKTNDLLITTDVKLPDYRNNSFVLENLLNLPKELSTIQLIQSSNLSELYRRMVSEKLDISEQLKYFSIEYVNGVDFREVEKLYNCGLLEKESFIDCKRKINESYKILQMIRH